MLADAGSTPAISTKIREKPQILIIWGFFIDELKLTVVHKVLVNMTNTNFSQVAAFIWSVADLLRGDFKQSQYGRVILPFTLLRRLECVFESSKTSVLETNEKVKAMPLPEEAKEKNLIKGNKGPVIF